jgi:hypothetical protein
LYLYGGLGGNQKGKEAVMSTIKDVFSIEIDALGYTVPREKWTKIGVAFQNRDGSLSVLLDSLPVDGKLHIRDRTQRSELK